MNWLQYIILVLGAAAMVVNPRIPRGGSVTPVYHFPVPPNLNLRAEMIFSEAVLVVLLVGLLLLFRWGTQALRWRQRFVVLAVMALWVYLFFHPLSNDNSIYDYVAALRGEGIWDFGFSFYILLFITSFAALLIPILGYDLEPRHSRLISLIFCLPIAAQILHMFEIHEDSPPFNPYYLGAAGVIILVVLAYLHNQLWQRRRRIECHQIERSAVKDTLQGSP